jgi:hypothetical protein
MSQDTFPFAADDDAAYDESKSNRKALMMAGGVAGALVLGAGGYFLLGGGGGDAASTTVIPRAPRIAAAAAPNAAAKAAVKLPVAYTAPLGRDPFKALYVVPVEAPAAATTSSTSSTSSTSTTASSSTSSTSGSSSSTGTSAPVAAPTSTRYALKLVSISKPSPEVRFTTWSVDGKSTTVIPAQRFGKYGELVVLAFGKNASGVVDSAIIQVGDDSPMTVKIGATVSVL